MPRITIVVFVRGEGLMPWPVPHLPSGWIPFTPPSEMIASRFAFAFIDQTSRNLEGVLTCVLTN